MSGSKVPGRNLLGLKVSLDRRLSESNFEDLSPECDNMSPSSDYVENNDGSEKCLVDINRNSITDAVIIQEANFCEVTTIEIPEKKVKKKTGINTLKKFARVPAIVSHVEKRVAASSGSALSCSPDDSLPDVQTIENNFKHNSINNSRESEKTSKKLRMSIRSRKKRNRRSRAIQCEGKSLWKPLESGVWQSVSGKKVELVEISLHDLCDTEIEILRQLGHTLLKDELDTPISIPKEYNPAVRRKWRHLINLGKKQKANSNKGSSKPTYPLFNVDISQSIENEKQVARLHQEEMAKLDDLEEDEGEETEKDLPGEDSYSLMNRRNSDPILSYSISTISDPTPGDGCSYFDNNIRTFDTLKEEDEDEFAASKRKSRLIEALQLSSITASAVCILDKDEDLCQQPKTLPKVLVECADFIETYALNTVGIFRTGGSKKRVKQMKEDYNNGMACVLTEETNPHDVAALFKEFLRCLPDPLLTRELYQGFIATAKLEYKDLMFEVIKHLVWLLPCANRDTLQLTLNCLKKVADHSQDSYNENGELMTGNRMDAQNLATLMAPNILHRCKVGKSSTSFQTDYGINPEDTKAAIDVVYIMIVNHEQLFKIGRNEHDRLLIQILESEPETLDYILKRKPEMVPVAPATSNNEEKPDFRIEIPKVPVSSNRRPSSAGPRTRYSMEDVSFQKSFSFNQGPYKPFVRRRKDSVTGSRPQSTRSDPPDRSSYRKSGISPTLRRKSSKIFGDADDCADKSTSSRDSNSPRDSGVVVSTPPFQRNSMRRSMEPDEIRAKKLNIDSLSTPNASPSQTKNRIVFRKHNRDRDSRDSAYDSGMTGMFSNRTSAANSIHIPTGDCPDKILDLPSLDFEESDDDFSVNASPTIEITDTSSSLDTVTQRIEKSKEKPVRKHSLPAYSTFDTRNRNSGNNLPTKSPSLDVQDTQPKRRSHSDIDFTDESQWPQWEIKNFRDSQFPSQETTL